MASAKWRAMGETEREPYDQRAAADKQRYEHQMSMYVPAPGFSSKGSRKRVAFLTVLIYWQFLVCLLARHAYLKYFCFVG